MTDAWPQSTDYRPDIGALFSSILPNFTSILPAWWSVYGWFFGVAIGGATYYVLSLMMPRPAARAAA